MKNFDVIIVGGGPAGMMAAVTAGNNGKKVLLIEKNKTLGRKLLATGNGRCNLTNRFASADRYHGASQEFITNVLIQFDQYKTMKFFESAGVVLKEEDRGRIFPQSDQSITILEALEKELEKLKVKVLTGTTVKSIEKSGSFTVQTEDGREFTGDNLVVTTGGKASFHFGSSGDGLFWSMKLGHHIVPIFAALVPIEIEEDWVKEAQGVKMPVAVKGVIDGKVVRETSGDLLFTHYGVSGPAAMAQAGAISSAIGEKKIELSIDLNPDISEKELDSQLERSFKESPKKSIGNVLPEFFPEKIALLLLELSDIDSKKKVSEISRGDRYRIVKTAKALTFTVKKVRPLKEAQVSRGGIDTEEIDRKTLESKLIKNLFFAGEIVDVDGDSGGFNLQWAWSSGFVAGNSV